MNNTDRAARAIPVLFDAGGILVVDKPSGIPSQPDRTGDADLIQRLNDQLGVALPGPVHRLDRPVSGVVVLARDRAMGAALSALFRERAVEKHYWAIVEGQLKGSGTLEHVLRHDGRAMRSRASQASGPDTDVHRLRYEVLATGERYSLIDVVPDGGAFHQIRSQLAAAGHPIRGDVKYGARRGERDRSIALHARSVAFRHPSSGEALRFEAPAPQGDAWRAMLALLA